MWLSEWQTVWKEPYQKMMRHKQNIESTFCNLVNIFPKCTLNSLLLLRCNHSIPFSVKWLYWTEFILSGMKTPSCKSSICHLWYRPAVSQQGVKVHFQNLGNWQELICGIYCIEVAIHLVSKGEPSLLGKVCLRTTQVAPTVALAGCRCCWAEAWFWLHFQYCRFFKKEHWIIRTRIGKLPKNFQIAIYLISAGGSLML